MENRGSNLGDMVFGVGDGTESNVNNVEERLRITRRKSWDRNHSVQADLHIESATQEFVYLILIIQVPMHFLTQMLLMQSFMLIKIIKFQTVELLLRLIMMKKFV